MTTARLVLPAYNEEEVIEGVVGEMQKALASSGVSDYEVIIVDDGSRDKTADIVRQLSEKGPVTLLQHEINRGLGSALKTGMVHAIKLSGNDDIILTAESDGTQSSDVIKQLIDAVENGADFAVASPLVGEGFKAVPFHRRVLSRGANQMYEVLFPMGDLCDYTNLLRGFKGSLLRQGLEFYGEEGFIDRPGFECVPDILLKLRRFHPKIAEVPVQIDFSQKPKASSMPVTRTILASLGVCAHHLFKR